MTAVIRIAVVGGGIMGLTSAARLVGVSEHGVGVVDRERGVFQKENNSVTVDLISEQFSPNTTGDLAAGICYAIGVNDTSDDLVMLVV